MGDHHNCRHDDETWRGLFRRWHAGEPAPALRAGAGVSAETWQANAKRLGMRICDLAADDPARRRVPAFADRADDYRHPKSRLSEGEWRALFRARASGVPDRVLAVKYGVDSATICSQAKARGITRAAIREAVAERLGEEGGTDRRRVAMRPSVTPPPPHPSAAPRPPPSPLGEGEGLGGVRIDVADAEATRRAFEAVIVEAGARGDYVEVALRARAKMQVERAVFARGAPPPPSAVALPIEDGEETTAPAPRVQLRDSQKPPEGDWATWLFLGGRGAGKTLAGAMWLSDMAEALGPGGRLALMGPTLHDVREVMIEGVSGIVGLPRWAGGQWGGRRPAFEPSRRRLAFPNGAMAYAFSAEDPDSLRGPQFGAAWADEFCAWPRTRGGPGETLALLRMGLRLTGPTPPPPDRRSPSPQGGAPPRLLVTTTPRPIAALRALRAEAGLVETHAATRDNAAHLSAGFVEGLERLYGGTRKAEQELEGRVVEAEGALFTSEMLARAREGAGGGPYDRVVVAIDPTTTAAGNACGIVVAGRSGERVHVLADRSVSGLGPDGWARRAVRAAEAFGAAALVAEVNQGGEMVRAVLKTAGCAVRVRPVRATKGKRVRAEPVAALYEQGRVTHAPGLGALEEELMAFGGEDEGRYDLDRADALVWAVTDLLIDRAGAGEGPRIRVLGWSGARSGLSARAW